MAIIGGCFVKKRVNDRLWSWIASGDILCGGGKLIPCGVDAVPRRHPGGTVVIEIAVTRHILTVQESGMFELRVLVERRAVNLAAVGIRTCKGPCDKGQSRSGSGWRCGWWNSPWCGGGS